MQPNLFGGNSETVMIDGTNVGPEELQGNGTGDIAELSRGRHVRVNEGIRGGVEGLQSPDNGGCGLHRAEERVRRGRLGDVIIACIPFLPFKMDGHFVSCLKERRRVRDDFVGFPEDQISQTDGTSSTGARDFEVFTAAHCKEESKEIILLEGNQERAGGGT